MTTDSEIWERRSKWAKALTSTDYPQATGFLHRKEGYCCLGVACKVFAEELGFTEKLTEGGYYLISHNFHSMDTVLDIPMRIFLGLSTNSMNILVHANDNGCTFEGIAKIIHCLPVEHSG